MLQNAYLLAKIGADTAENEQHFAEILPKIGNYPTGPTWPAERHGPRRDAEDDVRALEAQVQAEALAWAGKYEQNWQKFKLANFSFFAKFVIFWRARSRLYQREILQENMRLTAFFNLYKI